MLKGQRFALVAAFVAGAFASAASAQPVAAGADEVTVDARQARTWLMRIHEAASHRNFQGTFVVSAGGVVSSSHIAHFCVGTSQFERIESLDGQARQVFRYNDLVHTLWPANRVALVEQRNLMSTFPALLRSGDDRITEFYDVRSQGTQRIAGREADLLLLWPKDNLRYGYRLWVDKDTGLLLRVEVLNERIEVIESSTFSDLSVGVKAQPESVLLPMNRLAGYRVLRPMMTPARLDAEGWALRQGVRGFEQVSCVRRPLVGLNDDDSDSARPVLQAIYSDGLTHVSLFIEPYDAARHHRGMHAVIGATQTLMQRQGDSWVTLVGDVPAATLRQFASALEYKK
jgi:sigma-E factor negative regulatory protein RseB